MGAALLWRKRCYEDILPGDPHAMEDIAHADAAGTPRKRKSTSRSRLRKDEPPEGISERVSLIHGDTTPTGWTDYTSSETLAPRTFCEESTAKVGRRDSRMLA